jgi:biopolymer transport protein TolR
MNVVPYIDVMLVLLVIFMVTAPMLQQGVTVDLPTASTEILPTEKNEPMIVSVDVKGFYYLNIAEKPQTALEGRELAFRVAAELRRDPNRKVLVKGDKNVSYGAVIQAMSLLQRAGVTNVGLVTEQPQPIKG